MTTARYWTAQQVMDQAAIELGLSAPGATVYSSTDTNIILLRNLLNTAGQELALMHPWAALVKEHTITVSNPGDTGEYTLPTDFNGMIDQTGWDRTSVYPLAQHTSQTWQWRKADGTDPTWVEFRLDQNLLRVLPAPPANGKVIAFEYWSRYWAAVTATPTVLAKATCTISTDVIFFEPVVIVALLKHRYKEARGEDTTATLVAFEARYSAAIGREVTAPILRMGAPRDFKLIDYSNIPDRGYG